MGRPLPRREMANEIQDEFVSVRIDFWVIQIKAASQNFSQGFNWENPTEIPVPWRGLELFLGAQGFGRGGIQSGSVQSGVRSRAVP